MTTSDFGSSVFAGWRSSAADGWNDYTNHEFVRQLGDGSLPRSSFLHYLVQDYVFLIHFSRAWALAVVKSESLEEMKTAAGTVDGLVNHEMQLHVQICKDAGIIEEALYSAEEAFENLAYTRYVTDAGLSGDFLDMMAALAPCVFGYGEIGNALKQSAAKDTPYMDWIDTYSGTEYQEVCTNVGRMIDNSVAARLGDAPEMSPRWGKLCDRFRTATRLEIGFWDMGLRGE
ncbi:MAG: thiaminase II [Alphaproteobacteria bacterium]|nr:thiaminase II [Alphaproteobacteria bacterium]